MLLTTGINRIKHEADRTTRSRDIMRNFEDGGRPAAILDFVQPEINELDPASSKTQLLN